VKRICVSGSLLVFILLTLAEAHDPITTRVTWENDIARIVKARCLKCHTEEGPGRMPLTSYEEARPWARAIKEEVMTRRMPKWHAVRGYGDFSNDPSLSAYEIALIAAWADGGAPKGKNDGIRETPQPDVRKQSERLATREAIVPCREQPAPEGTLLAVQPELAKDRSVGIAVRLPDGGREIVAWIKGYEPEFPTTYWLRNPLELPPGSTLLIQPEADCTIRMTLRARR
jgi:hypothetical protein